MRTLSKSLTKAAEQLADKAMMYSMLGKKGKPGEMISKLSEEEKEIVKQLKPEHFKTRLFK